jgi:hypothetical protein
MGAVCTHYSSCSARREMSFLQEITQLFECLRQHLSSCLRQSCVIHRFIGIQLVGCLPGCAPDNPPSAQGHIPVYFLQHGNWPGR